MSDYFERIERQLVKQAAALYPAAADGSSRAPADDVGRSGVRSAASIQPDRWHDGRRRAGGWRSGGADRLGGFGVGTFGGLIAALVVSLGASTAAPDAPAMRGKGRLVTIRMSTTSNGIGGPLALLGVAGVSEVSTDCLASAGPVQTKLPPVGTRGVHLRGPRVAARRDRIDRRQLPPAGVTLPRRLLGATALPDGGELDALIPAPVCVRGARGAPAFAGATG
jgi:hypothetical protein